ncbi:5'-nucleotidase C-terminal domain-containing protein [Prevotella sp. PMUR]|uniref:5'-nucleotidase C-terminal domain-containing protein n=2 Tax=Xylanibacter muris TaxID=2736290 RepID=A0ABX2AL26_9BACT|nr:5'-nucleotidase C-terminal domain-containing protein [Xylanibacter muris]
MTLKVVAALLFAVCAAETSNAQGRITNVVRTRILVDSVYDTMRDTEADSFIAPYRQKVDSMMSPVVGHIAVNAKGYRPESPLSNLLADILVWASARYGEKPLVGVYNMGGIRASLVKGPVTFGDVLDVAPFENKISFLTLSGDNLMELFREMASVGGEGVSHGVELCISKDKKLLSARLHGKEIKPHKKYRIVTIDYLAQGNDRMTAFKKKTGYVAPPGEENNTRYIISDYFRQAEKEGRAVNCRVEGRIIVK